MKNAIVTFVIGERYQKMHEIFKPSVESYCKKFDIDYIILDKGLDDDRNFHTIDNQKLLITSQEWSNKYDNIMWIDSDVYISPNAKNVFDEVVNGKICMANDIYNDIFYHSLMSYKKGWIPTKEFTRDDAIKGCKDMAIEYKCYSETDINVEKCLNQGVIIFQPKYHTEYLVNLYNEEKKRSIDHPLKDKYGRKNPHGAYWYQYKFQADGMLHMIDHKYNKIWCMYRSLHYEPYDNPSELILPLKSFIECSYFCHFTDMENADILCTVKDLYIESPNSTLIVNYIHGSDLSWMLSKYIRSKDFENIYIVSNNEEAKNFIVSRYPREQFGFRFPDHKYTFVNEIPLLSERCIICDSDWVNKINFEYILHLFNNNENKYCFIHTS